MRNDVFVYYQDIQNIVLNINDAKKMSKDTYQKLIKTFDKFIDEIESFLIYAYDFHYGYFLINLKTVYQVQANMVAAISLAPGIPVLVINPITLGKLKLKEIIFTLCHEIEHLILSHLSEVVRMNPFHNKSIHLKLNIACDVSVNERLKEAINSGFTLMSMTPGCVTVQTIEKMINCDVEEDQHFLYYYNLIKDLNSPLREDFDFLNDIEVEINFGDASNKKTDQSSDSQNMQFNNRMNVQTLPNSSDNSNKDYNNREQPNREKNDYPNNFDDFSTFSMNNSNESNQSDSSEKNAAKNNGNGEHDDFSNNRDQVISRSNNLMDCDQGSDQTQFSNQNSASPQSDRDFYDKYPKGGPNNRDLDNMYDDLSSDFNSLLSDNPGSFDDKYTKGGPNNQDSDNMYDDLSSDFNSLLSDNPGSFDDKYSKDVSNNRDSDDMYDDLSSDFNSLLSDNPGSFDDLSHMLNETNDADSIEQIINSYIEKTIESMSEKARGLFYEKYKSLILKLNEKPVINWKKELRKFLGNIPNGKRKTIMRLNRRQPERIDLRGCMTDKSVKLVLAIDTSGSMDNEILSRVLNEIHEIVKNKQTDITVIECDAKIQKVYKVKKIKDIKYEVYGRGGTKFTPVVEYVNNHKYFRDSLLIYFTDGYGERSIPKPLVYRMMWVVFGKYLSVGKKIGSQLFINTTTWKVDKKRNG